MSNYLHLVRWFFHPTAGVRSELPTTGVASLSERRRRRRALFFPATAAAETSATRRFPPIAPPASAPSGRIGLRRELGSCIHGESEVESFPEGASHGQDIFATDFLEIRAKEPSVHVLVIPGNPGIVAFYKDFVEELYENLGGQASITERGRLFSLHEQIDHKVDFIEQEFQHSEQSLVLVGHSIGAYICLEIFKRLQKKVKLCVGLYPFLTLNKKSMKQSAIGYIARSSLLSKGVSSFVSFIGSLQASVTRGIVRRLLGPSWSVTAVEATCGHLLWYHTMRNVLFMAMTEFTKLSEEPDWNFISAKQDQIAFLFDVDDHWGPLAHLEEISKRAPGVALSVETEGHTHGYCCTEAGSFWAADYVANLIKTKF
uniref:AB hydrolase-1 domain-containing protein n=1 Tax=Oryza rufipogon TaxID=4529 RepID=A0A0E0N7V0_ORYRU